MVFAKFAYAIYLSISVMNSTLIQRQENGKNEYEAGLDMYHNCEECSSDITR